MEKTERNAPCWCGSGKKYKVCHAAFDDKLRKYERAGHIIPTHDIIKTKEQIDGIRESGKVNIAVLDYVEKHIRAGMSTEEIDRLVYEKTTELGGVPAPLGYEGFPKSCCTSINDQVCHGIPDETVILQEGDIINVDVSTVYHGYYSDSSRMFCIGRVSPEKKQLVAVTKECVEIGIKNVKPWIFLGDMTDALHTHAKQHGYTIVEEIGGHGVGLAFHEEPYVCHVAPKGTEMLLVPGMVFTIEPMVNMGTAEIFVDSDNDWTTYTDDAAPSAQWEVTVAVTEDGCEVLAY